MACITGGDNIVEESLRSHICIIFQFSDNYQIKFNSEMLTPYDSIPIYPLCITPDSAKQTPTICLNRLPDFKSYILLQNIPLSKCHLCAAHFPKTPLYMDCFPHSKSAETPYNGISGISPRPVQTYIPSHILDYSHLD